MTRRRSTYSMPGSSVHDDFRAKQEPKFEPVDDLSRFVLDRIREAETEPVADQVEPNGQPMAYRYAKHVRDDMIPYRRIAAAYCRAVAGSATTDPIALLAGGDDTDGLNVAMLAIAHRWDDHHDFRKEWLIDG